MLVWPVCVDVYGMKSKESALLRNLGTFFFKALRCG